MMGQLLKYVFIAALLFLVMALVMPLLFIELRGQAWLITSGCVSILSSVLGAVVAKLKFRHQSQGEKKTKARNKTFLLLTWRQWIGSGLIAVFIFVSLLIAFPDKDTATWIALFAAGSLFIAVVPVMEKKFAYRLRNRLKEKRSPLE